MEIVAGRPCIPYACRPFQGLAEMGEATSGMGVYMASFSSRISSVGNVVLVRAVRIAHNVTA